MQQRTAIGEGMSTEGLHAPARYWLVVGRGGAREALTLRQGPGGGILPVFGAEEDVDTFLTPLGASGGRFAASPIAAEDLAALLSGPLSGVGTVALDPTLEMDPDTVLGLVGVDRETFVASLRKKRTAARARTSSHARGWSVRARLPLIVLALICLSLIIPNPAHAQEEPDGPVTEVDTEAELREAWADPTQTSKNFHWRLSGARFRDIRLLLDEQARAILASADALSERARRIGGTTVRPPE